MMSFLRSAEDWTGTPLLRCLWHPLIDPWSSTGSWGCKKDAELAISHGLGLLPCLIRCSRRLKRINIKFAIIYRTILRQFASTWCRNSMIQSTWSLRFLSRAWILQKSNQGWWDCWIYTPTINISRSKWAWPTAKSSKLRSLFLKRSDSRSIR